MTDSYESALSRSQWHERPQAGEWQVERAGWDGDRGGFVKAWKYSSTIDLFGQTNSCIVREFSEARVDPAVRGPQCTMGRFRRPVSCEVSSLLQVPGRKAA